MKKVLLIFLTIILLATTIQLGCGKTPSAGSITSDISFNTNERFDIKLFQAISSDDEGKNVFISPISIALALTMTMNGADGDTLEAMKQTLELEGLTDEEINEYYQSLIETLTTLDPEVILQIANSIWYRQGIPWRQEFLDICSTYYDAEVEPISTADVINSWVNDKTNGLIEEIIDDIPGDLVMYLINAIYFKGTWTYSFDEENTQDAPFYLADGSQIQCQMMALREHFKYYEDDEVKVIDIPYGDGEFVMTVILPADGKDIDEFVSEFTESDWEAWLSGMSMEEVQYSMPKFKLEYEKKLNDVLKALGMEIAFDGDTADFSRMREGGELWIGEVRHKSFVEVNEEGTEAAAVTVVSPITTTVFDPFTFKTMRVDSPFVFVIRDVVSDNMLFMGKIVEPTLE